MNTFKGLIPATFTPFAENGSLLLEQIPQHYALLRDAGIQHAFVGGTTGEFSSLSTRERMTLTEAWLKAAPNTFSVWVHVGHNGQSQAIELARHAASCGAKAISALAPGYFKPDNIAALIDFLSPIAAAAPDLPFYYYEIPSMTGVTFAPEHVLDAAVRAIPSFAGLKFSSHNLFQLQLCRTNHPDRDVLFGSDEMLLGALTLGATGAIGSTYNVAAPLYFRMLEAFQNGQIELARDLQRQSALFVRTLIEFGVLASQKAIMKMLGADCGPVRPPLRSLSPSEESRLYEQMAPLDIFPRPLERPR